MARDASINVLQRLNDEQRAILAGLGTPVSYPQDHIIFKEGEPSFSVLLVQTGNVKITSIAPDGSEIILAIRGVNEVLGDEGVLMEEVRAATVTTISEVTGLVIGADELLKFVEAQKLWPVMYRAVVRRRRQQDQRVMLARLDVKSRLARWLLELAADVGEQTNEGWVIETTLSQHDWAGRIGASRDAVAIELRRLREQEIVKTARGKIVLRDTEALRRIALI